MNTPWSAGRSHRGIARREFLRGFTVRMRLLRSPATLAILLAVCGSVLPTDVCVVRGAEVARTGLLEGFVDDLGRPVNQRTLDRPYRLLVFGYTSCPDVCPLTLVAVHRALALLGERAAAIDPVFVTVDPDRDSVQKIHAYVTAFDPRIRGYRGDEQALDRLTQRMHVRYWREALSDDAKDYAMSHTATLFLLAHNEQVLDKIEHVANPAALTKAIVKAVQSAAAKSIARGSS